MRVAVCLTNGIDEMRHTNRVNQLLLYTSAAYSGANLVTTLAQTLSLSFCVIDVVVLLVEATLRRPTTAKRFVSLVLLLLLLLLLLLSLVRA